jgi:hypothetical protein
MRRARFLWTVQYGDHLSHVCRRNRMYHLFYVGIVLHLAFMGWIIFWLVRLYFGGGFNPLCVI